MSAAFLLAACTGGRHEVAYSSTGVEDLHSIASAGFLASRRGTLPSGNAKSEERDIALVNLKCAGGLRGAEHLEVEACLAKLDDWAKHVKTETERHLYRFRQHPEEYESSEGFFRILMMAVVLQEDFHVRYDPARISAPSQTRVNDGFFRDSQDVFLHGLLGPRRTGTCSSIPVLFVAIGRRLGYPLKLVTAKAHLFARWDSADGRERFNIETTNKGLNSFPDEYYEKWPFPMTEADLRSGRYLRSLSPNEELALFLQTRGLCLKAAGRALEARAAWEAAHRLAPEWPEHDLLIARLNLNPN
jgi:hypothetical protein